MLPLTCLFGLGAVVYSVNWSMQRSDSPVCISCERQKAIVEEVYFSKRINPIDKVARNMP